MKDGIIKFFMGICTLAIIAGASAVVKVQVLENDMNWIKDMLVKIERHIEENNEACM